MVNRMLNMAIASVRRQPLWWMKEMGVEWTCRCCGNRMEKGNFTVEVCYKYTPPKQFKEIFKSEKPNEIQAIKTYLCIECGIKIFEEAVDKMKLAKNVGADGVRLMEAL